MTNLVDVLVVEDNPYDRELFKQILESKGYSTDAVCCYTTLEEWIRGNKPRYVLMDYDPEECGHSYINGYKSAKLLRERFGKEVFIHLFSHRISSDIEPNENMSLDQMVEEGTFDAYTPKNLEMASALIEMQKKT